jgi:hypothetical protein
MGLIPDDPAFDAELAHATDSARAELAQTTLPDVQRQTAITWLGRCLVAYENFSHTRSIDVLLDAEEYGSEACEHAALSFDATLCSRVGNIFLSTRQRALVSAGLVTSPRLNPRTGFVPRSRW